MHQREHTVIIRPFPEGLILNALLSKRNPRSEGVWRDSYQTVKKQEIDLAEQFAKALLKPFRAQQFHDEYAERVKRLIESKQKGKAAPSPEKPPRMAPVIDLMSALKKSLAGTGKTAKPNRSRKLKKTA